jgi:hypothetical protein
LFVQGIPHTGAYQEKRKKLARTFSFTFLYLDDGLSLNNSKLSRIHRIELEIQDNTDKTWNVATYQWKFTI